MNKLDLKYTALCLRCFWRSKRHVQYRSKVIWQYLETRISRSSRIGIRVSSWDCQLTFDRYCSMQSKHFRDLSVRRRVSVKRKFERESIHSLSAFFVHKINRQNHQLHSMQSSLEPTSMSQPVWSISESLGSVSNNDVNGNENVTWKERFGKWWLLCDYCSFLASLLGTFRSDYDNDYDYEFSNVYPVRMRDCVRLSRQLVLSSKSHRHLYAGRTFPPVTGGGWIIKVETKTNKKKITV